MAMIFCPAGLTVTAPPLPLLATLAVAGAGPGTVVQSAVSPTPARLADTLPVYTGSVEGTPRVTQLSGAVLSCPASSTLLLYCLLTQQTVRADHLDIGCRRDVAGDSFPPRETLTGAVETESVVSTVLRTLGRLAACSLVSVPTLTGDSLPLDTLPVVVAEL